MYFWLCLDQLDCLSSHVPKCLTVSEDCFITIKYYNYWCRPNETALRVVFFFFFWRTIFRDPDEFLFYNILLYFLYFLWNFFHRIRIISVVIGRRTSRFIPTYEMNNTPRVYNILSRKQIFFFFYGAIDDQQSNNWGPPKRNARVLLLFVGIRWFFLFFSWSIGSF